MFVAFLAVALSTTFSLIYVTFYSMSSQAEKGLNQLNQNFRYAAAYTVIIIWLEAEMSLNPTILNEKNNLTLMALLIYLTISLFVLTIIFLHCFTTSVAFWLTFSWITILVLLDGFGFATSA